MEILAAILIIALIAAVVFAVMQRRPAGARGPGRPRTSPIGRRDRGIAQRDPMAAAVSEHAQAIDPQDVVAAEQRLRAEARQIAAGLHTEAHRSEHQRVADQVAGQGSYTGDPRIAGDADPAYRDPRLDDNNPANGARTDGYGAPARDPRYDDPNYDGRLDDDRGDPRHDDRGR